MKLISINSLDVGEKLGYDIRSGKGSMLLRAETLLTDNMIQRLKKLGIYSVYIDDDMFKDVEVNLALSVNTKARTLQLLEDAYGNFKRGRQIDLDPLRLGAREIYEEVRVSVREPINMVSTFSVEEPVLMHCVNVATMTAALATQAKLPMNLIENYTFAALVHDICLEDINDDNAKSYDHVKKIYEYLKAANIDATAYMAAHLHHERFDGTGGPRKVVGKQIQEGARLLAAADIFDSTLSGIGGVKRLEAHLAIEYIQSLSGSALDPDVVRLFTENIAIYPTGAVVDLNNKFQAMVLKQNPGIPSRPVLRMMSKNADERIEINMLTNHTVFIEKVNL